MNKQIDWKKDISEHVGHDVDYDWCVDCKKALEVDELDKLAWSYGCIKAESQTLDSVLEIIDGMDSVKSGFTSTSSSYGYNQALSTLKQEISKLKE